MKVQTSRRADAPSPQSPAPPAPCVPQCLPLCGQGICLSRRGAQTYNTLARDQRYQEYEGQRRLRGIHEEYQRRMIMPHRRRFADFICIDYRLWLLYPSVCLWSLQPRKNYNCQNTIDILALLSYYITLPLLKNGTTLLTCSLFQACYVTVAPEPDALWESTAKMNYVSLSLSSSLPLPLSLKVYPVDQVETSLGRGKVCVVWGVGVWSSGS